MARKAAVAGQFYEAENMKLEKQIQECFSHKLGPGDLPITKRKGFVKGLIVPHAGYAYSGPCAAWAYKEIAEAEQADVYMLLGPNHFGNGTSISLDDWETPFGVIKTDRNFATELIEATGLASDEKAHEHEHSIEVQLPFLQFANKSLEKDTRIVAISVSSDLDIAKFSKDLKAFLSKQQKKVTIIVSSDFTHYGTHYHYLPFSTDVAARLKELDQGAINLILDKKPKEFVDYIEKTGDTICGYLPISILISVLREEKTELLMYYTSTEMTGDHKNSVSYASIIFK